MKETTDGIQWYAIQLRPRCEKFVAVQLRNKGYEEYLPMYRSRRRWSDRVKEIQLPLFPGHIVIALGLGGDRQRQHCPHRPNHGEEGRSVMGPGCFYSSLES